MKPDAAVVDHLVAVAGDKARSRLSGADAARDTPRDREARSPQRRSRSGPGTSWTVRAQRAATALALALVVGLGWWHSPSIPDAPTPVAQDTRSRSPVPQERTPRAAEAAPLRSASLPAWDDSDEMVRLHRRIELVQARSTTSEWMPVSAGR
jgi:hypothetical protein